MRCVGDDMTNRRLKELFAQNQVRLPPTMRPVLLLVDFLRIAETIAKESIESQLPVSVDLGRTAT
jgi:hypothetical protein